MSTYITIRAIVGIVMQKHDCTERSNIVIIFVIAIGYSAEINSRVQVVSHLLVAEKGNALQGASPCPSCSAGTADMLAIMAHKTDIPE